MVEGGPRGRAGSGGALFPPGYTGSGRTERAAATSDDGPASTGEPTDGAEVGASTDGPVDGPVDGNGHDEAGYPTASSPAAPSPAASSPAAPFPAALPTAALPPAALPPALSPAAFTPVDAGGGHDDADRAAAEAWQVYDQEAASYIAGDHDHDHDDAGEGDDPTAYNLTAYEPTTYQPTAYEPTTYQPTAYQPTAYQPTAYEPDPYNLDPDEDDPAAYGPDPDEYDPYNRDPYNRDPYNRDPYYQDVEGEDGAELGEGVPVDGRTGEPVRVATRRRRRGRWRHPVLAVFLVVILVVILLGGSGILWAVHQINPSGSTGARVVVTIPAGASTSEIGDDLARAGVIHSGSLFRYYLKVQGDSNLLPGTYLLARNEPYNVVVTALQAGPVVLTDKLVIPEGFTLREIAGRVAALPGTHLSAARFVALSTSGSVRSPLEPAGVDNLEGLLFPATYSIRRTDSETTILEELIGTFDQQATVMHLAAGAAKLHMTPYQLITVASIVQGEAKFDDQFGDVASVIYNRLRAGIALGTDSTLIYALRRADPDLNVAKVNLEQRNPYNTRLHKGLPPTPIDNPGLPALAAAITPPHTTLRYFVEVNPDGTLGFARNGAGFNQLVERCRANHLC